MANEELESCSYPSSFADRYQADLELIYQKYDRLDKGCIESHGILLSNLDCEENDGIDSSSDDEGWESDSSGHTSTRHMSSQDEAFPHNNKLGKEELEELDVQNCEITEKSKPVQLNNPLSSTLASNSAPESKNKMDPKLSPVEIQTKNLLKYSKILENNNKLDQRNGNFLPGIRNGNILTSTTLEESSPDLPRHKVLLFQNKASWTQTTTSRELEERGLPGPERISSFAQTVLDTRNRIANVLFKAVMSFHNSNYNTDSGYDSLSTDTSSSTSKESLFLPDKLLNEFNNRLTAEMMTNENNQSFGTEPNHTCAASNTSLIPNTKRTQPLQEKSMSLFTGRRSIKFNPSLPGLKKGLASSSPLNETKCVYIQRLSMNTKTVDDQGRLDSTFCTKAVLKISPVQGTTPTSLAPKNAISTWPGEPFGVRNSPLKLLPNHQEPMTLKLRKEQKQQPLTIKPSSKLQLGEKSSKSSKPVMQRLASVPRSSVSITPRCSVLLTNCLPVTNSEILRHSKNLSDFQNFMQNHEKMVEEVLPGKDRGSIKHTIAGHNRLENPGQRQCRTLKLHSDLQNNFENNLSGQDGTEDLGFSFAGQDRAGHSGKIPGFSRKRNFESALSCSSEKTSPKRTCTRSNNKEKQTSLEAGFSSVKLKVGRENVINAVERNTLELFKDLEDQYNNTGGRNIEEQESRESNAWSENVECKERRHSQKLFKDETRSSCGLVQFNPCDKVRIPWKTSNIDNTERDDCNSRHKDNGVEGRHLQYRGNSVRIDKGTPRVVLPMHGKYSKKQLLRKDVLEEFKKTPSRLRIEDEDLSMKATFLSEKVGSSFTTTCRDNDDDEYKSYARPVYEHAREERCSGGFHKTSRNKSYRGGTSRPIFDHDAIYWTREENDSTVPHKKVTRRNTLTSRTAEKACQESPSRRKRYREFKEKAQERFDNGVCLNKTFKIDERHCVWDRHDSTCTTSGCRKLLCLTCGNFP